MTDTPSISASALTFAAASKDDLPAVRKLARVIWHAHYPGIITREQIDYMLDRGYALDVLESFLGRRERGFELARVNGDLVGFAGWYLTDQPHEAKLDKLYVLPSEQRRGVGARLIERVIAGARAAAATTLILNVNKRNAQAIAAYGKHGFAIRDVVVVDIGNDFAMDDYVMAKAI